MIKAREIADMVGVSVSTVGRALADDPRISEDTKIRVRKAAERVGYAGNLAARLVRGGTSNLIGLLVPEVSNDFYSTIAQSLSDVCGRQGYRLVLSLTRDDAVDELRNIRELVAAQAAGIIIVPSPNPTRASLQLLRQLPHVQLLRRVAGMSDTWFGIDDAPSFEAAVRHLTNIGHRRIAYIGGEGVLSTGASRMEGFRRGCLDAGLDLERCPIFMGPTSREFGHATAKRALCGRNSPTALVAGAFNITMGIIEWVEENQLNSTEVPSLVGFGDPVWFKWWRSGLTTIRPPVDNLATSCGLWFLNQLQSRPREGLRLPEHNVLVSSSLVLRNSTRPLPGP